MTIQELPMPQTSTGGCGCGGHDSTDPLIDATAIPHRLRHAAVLGAAQSMSAGESFIIRAPHLPRPLLAQIMQLRASGPSRSSPTAPSIGMCAPHVCRSDP